MKAGDTALSHLHLFPILLKAVLVKGDFDFDVKTKTREEEPTMSEGIWYGRRCCKHNNLILSKSCRIGRMKPIYPRNYCWGWE